MTDEVRFALLLILNLAAILLAAWLAGRYAAHRVGKLLEAERRRAEAARRQAQAEILAGLPPVPPELEQMAEVERWVLVARNLQLLLVSLGTLVRIGLRADESGRRGVLTEIDRSLKHLGRLENKWLNASLPVIAYVRQLDPAKGKGRNQSLEAWITRLNRMHVQAAQSLRRAASLCDPDQGEEYGDNLANAYLHEADRAAADMAGLVASALDRIEYLRKQWPEQQAQRVAAAVADRVSDALEGEEGNTVPTDVSASPEPTVNLVTSAGRAAR